MNNSLSLNMARIEDQAVCVRVWDWSESSQTAVLLTRDHGMIRVIAKGSKRERAMFSGGLELCTMGQMGAIVRPSSELALLTHWDLISPMLGIRRSLLSYNAAMLGVDLIPRLIQDHDPHPEVYEALLSLLDFCDGSDKWNHGGECEQGFESQAIGMLSWYLWTVLVAVGAMPVVDHNVLTGEALVDAEVYGFSAQLGGVTQDPITSPYAEAAGERHSPEMPSGVWRIRAQTVEMMSSLGQSPPVSLFFGRSKVQNDRLCRLLCAYIRERTGTEIPAMKWLLGSNG